MKVLGCEKMQPNLRDFSDGRVILFPVDLALGIKEVCLSDGTMGPLCSQFGFLFFYQAERLILPLSLKNLGYPLKAGQNACVDVAVGWANGFIVNPTLMPSSVGCEEHAMQPTQLILGRCGVRDSKPPKHQA